MGEGLNTIGGGAAEAQRLLEIQRKAAEEAARKQQEEAAQRQQAEQQQRQEPAKLPDTIDKATFVENVHLDGDKHTKQELEQIYDEFAGADGKLDNDEFEQLFLQTVTAKAADGVSDADTGAMMKQLSDEDLDQLPTEKKQAMFDALDKGYTSGEEAEQMGRLAASIARKDPAKVTDAMLGSLGSGGALAMAQALTKPQLAALVKDHPAVVAGMRNQLDGLLQSEAQVEAIKTIDAVTKNPSMYAQGVEKGVETLKGGNEIGKGVVDATARQEKLAKIAATEHPAEKEGEKEEGGVGEHLERLNSTIDLLNAKPPKDATEASEQAKKVKDTLRETLELTKSHPELRAKLAGVLDKLGAVASLPADLAAPIQTLAALTSGLNADGKPMGASEYTQKLMELPEQAKGLGESGVVLFEGVERVAGKLPGMDKVFAAARKPFEVIAKAVADGKDELASAMRKTMSKLLGDAAAEGATEAGALSKLLAVAGPLLEKANIALTAVTTSYQMMAWCLQNVYQPAKEALTAGFSKMEWGGDVNDTYKELHQLQEDFQETHDRLDPNAPDYAERYQEAANSAKALNDFVEDRLGTAHGSGAFMTTVSDQFCRERDAKLKSEVVEGPDGKPETLQQIYVKGDQATRQEQMQLAKVMGPLAERFMKNQMAKDGVTATGIEPKDLTAGDVARMDYQQARIYVANHEEELAEIPQVQKTALIDKIAGVTANDEDVEAVGKLTAAYLKSMPEGQDVKAAYDQLLAKNGSLDKDDAARVVAASLTTAELAKLPASVREDLIDQMASGATNDAENAAIGKVMASYAGDKEGLTSAYNRLMAKVDDNGKDDIVEGLIKHLEPADLAKLDPDVRSDMLHQLTTGMVGQAEHEALAKLANAVLTRSKDEADKLGFYRELMFKVPVTDTDNVALLMTKDLSRGEIAELPAEIRQNLHDQMNGGWVSAEEQVQVQKLADYLT